MASYLQYYGKQEGRKERRKEGRKEGRKEKESGKRLRYTVTGGAVHPGKCRTVPSSRYVLRSRKE